MFSFTHERAECERTFLRILEEPTSQTRAVARSRCARPRGGEDRSVRRAGRDRREAASQRDAGQRLANDPLGDERWNAWIELVAAAIAAEAPETAAQAAAQRLTALVDG